MLCGDDVRDVARDSREQNDSWLSCYAWTVSFAGEHCIYTFIMFELERVTEVKRYRLEEHQRCLGHFTAVLKTIGTTAPTSDVYVGRQTNHALTPFSRLLQPSSV